jgi:hypothetical protein
LAVIIPSQITDASSSETSTRCFRPDRSRSRSAASTPKAVSIATPMSAICPPGMTGGPSGEPVIVLSAGEQAREVQDA